MRKIVFADSFNLTEGAENAIRGLGEVTCLMLGQRDRLLKECREAEIIIAEYARIDKEIFSAAKALKGVVVYGVGTNHIDIEEASKRGIPVVNCRGGNAEAVAELAISMMLECLRWTGRANEFVRGGKWENADSASLPSWMNGRELRGKKLGILGAGAIGTRIGELGEAFGMEVTVTAGRTESHPRFPWRPLEEVLAFSDILSVNVPLTPGTRGLLSRERLEMIKDGSILVITSRGGIADEEALAEMLASGRLAGAGLDVFAEEPLPVESPLLKAPNVVLTPHMGGSTEESVENISEIIASSCRQILAGEIPPTTVNAGMLGKKTR